MGFFRTSSNDDPGTIESIEKASARAKKSRPPTLRDIPKLTKDLLMQNSNSTSLKEAQEKATLAAKKLYELCEVGRKANREIMVASGEYDVIGPLTQCLLHEPIYDIPIDSNIQSKHSSSTMVKIPHQQPKMEEDGINNNDTSIKIDPENDDKDVVNGETCSGDDGKESKSTPTETVSSMTSPIETKSPTAENKKRSALTKKKRMDEKLHFVCLALNNLSIPFENKRVMVGERGAKRLIGNLCQVIAAGKKESHLCCIILMNLSFYEPGLTIIGQFSPRPKSTPTDDRTNENDSSGTAKKALKTTTTILKRAATAVIKQPKLTPLENPNSLLRILQDVITTVERGTSDFRWAFGLLANLSRHPENALLIGLTGIPRMAIESLKLSQTPSRQWATNSLEDFSLYFLLHLAEASSQGLKDALEVVIPIMNGTDCPEKTASNSVSHATSGDSGNENSNNNNNYSQAHRGGIQSLKATMICAFLGLEWKDFPDHGIIAAGTVSELMGNTFERVGKKQVYTDNDFALRTAVSAYAALARAAAKADAGGAESPRENSRSCVHTKVMALPTSVALLFQIINAIALHWGEENISSSSGSGNESYADAYHWDIKAGDLAVGAIMSLLPALLEKTGEENASTKHHPSMTTQHACADLSKVFVFFSKKTNSISVRARAAEVAEKLTKSAFGSALPLLEASYDLCKNYGTHRLQKNFL